MTSKILAIAVGLALALAGCAHHAPAPGSAPVNPIAPVALPKTSPEAQAAFDEGVRTMKMGRKHYKAALEPFTRATRLDPRLYEAWHDLGVVHTALGDFDGAVDDFKHALDVQPGARKTVLAYGESLRRNHEPKKAADLYARWLTSDPGDFEMRARYSQALRDAGADSLDAALEQARLLLVSAGGNVSHTVIAYNALALSYYKMGKFELAETALRKAADLDPEERVRLEQPGARGIRARSRPGGFLGFSKSVRARPQVRGGPPQQGGRFHGLRRLQARAAGSGEGGRDRSERPESQVALGVAARGDGKLDQARKAYERALDIEPDYPPALYDLGVLYMDFDKDPAKAKDMLTQYLAAVSKDDGRRADAEARLRS